MDKQNNKTELLNQLRLDKSKVSKGHSSSTVSTVLWVVVAILLSGGGVYYWQSSSLSKTEQPIPVAATSSHSLSASTSTRALNEDKILDASGYITARRIATVSAEVMGLILSVDVEEGMVVKEGQVLAKLDSALSDIALNLAKSQVAMSEARLQSLQVDVAESQRELKRLKNLGNAGNYASESQLSQAQASVDRLQANLRSAQADLLASNLQVQRQQSLLDDHVIRAPFEGVVTAKNAQAGEIVSPSSAGGGFTRTGICTIVDMDSLEIQVDVNEAFIARVREGQKVEAVLDAYPDWKIPASVIAVIPTADRAKATVRVRIRIDEKDSKILPDMGVKVSFLKEGANE